MYTDVSEKIMKLLLSFPTIRTLFSIMTNSNKHRFLITVYLFSPDFYNIF